MPTAVVQDPSDVEVWPVSFSDLLDSGETLDDAGTWTPPSGVTCGTPQLINSSTGTQASVTIDSGDEWERNVDVQVTTSEGRTLNRTLRVLVEDK